MHPEHFFDPENLSDEDLTVLANNGDSLLNEKFETTRSVDDVHDYLRRCIQRLTKYKELNHDPLAKATVQVLKDNQVQEVTEQVGIILDFLKQDLLFETDKNSRSFPRASSFKLISIPKN